MRSLAPILPARPVAPDAFAVEAQLRQVWGVLEALQRRCDALEEELGAYRARGLDTLRFRRVIPESFNWEDLK